MDKYKTPWADPGKNADEVGDTRSSEQAKSDAGRIANTGEAQDSPIPIITNPAGVTTNEPTEAYNPNDELNIWKNRIGLSRGRGLAHQKLTNTLMGFNHRIVNNPVPTNREVMGMVFFTRPDLNLDEMNVANSRRLSDMAMQPKDSLDYSILAALDPQCPYTAADFNKPALGMPCDPKVLFDNKQAFIPLLSTMLQSFSGLPDNTVDSWMSDEGLMREQWGMVDSTYQVNYAYSASSTFNNMVGDPVMRMIAVWLEYMAGVKSGRFKPKIINSIQRRIDYQSRAYMIKYDPLGNKILRFSTACVLWPQNDNAGAMAVHDGTKNIVADDITLSIQWQCIGARYNDPLYMEMFNETVAYFNPGMIPRPGEEEFVPLSSDLRKLESHELPTFNYYGYPYIDSINRTISWYVTNEQYDFIMSQAGIR